MHDIRTLNASCSYLENSAIFEQVNVEEFSRRHLLPVDDGVHGAVDARLSDGIPAKSASVADEYQRPHGVHAAEDACHVRRSLDLEKTNY